MFFLDFRIFLGGHLGQSGFVSKVFSIEKVLPWAIGRKIRSLYLGVYFGGSRLGSSSPSSYKAAPLSSPHPHSMPGKRKEGRDRTLEL